MIFFHERHHARLYWHVDARHAAQFHKAEKVLVVEKELRIEMAHARVHFDFQIADILAHVFALGMPFGIARRRDIERIALRADKGNEIARVAEIGRERAPLDAVAAQAQHPGAAVAAVRLQAHLPAAQAHGRDAETRQCQRAQADGDLLVWYFARRKVPP